MDSILTVVREWQGVGRTDVGRGQNGRGGQKERQKQLTDWEESARCNTKKELKGRKDKRRHIHGDKRKRRDKIDNPFKRNPICNWEAWETVLQTTTDWHRWIFITIFHYSLNISGNDTLQSCLLSTSLIWLNASPSRSEFTLENAVAPALASHTHMLSPYKSNAPHCFTLAGVDGFEIVAPGCADIHERCLYPRLAKKQCGFMVQ